MAVLEYAISEPSKFLLKKSFQNLGQCLPPLCTNGSEKTVTFCKETLLEDAHVAWYDKEG